MSTEFITVREVAVYLRVSENHVYHLVHKRGLPGERVKGRWVFRQSLVDRWVYAHVRPHCLSRVVMRERFVQREEGEARQPPQR